MKSTLTETDFLRMVLKLARLLGWSLIHHDRPAMTKYGWRTSIQGTAGFPDLILCRPSSPKKPARVLVVELKTATGTLTELQQQWIESLCAAGVDVWVWRPEDWDKIEAELRR